MKSQIKKYLMLFALLLLPLSMHAQGKVYTRRIRISDFSVRTTMVAVNPDWKLCASLREEVVSRWRISSYEFCTPEEYESMKSRSDLYFLNIEESEGICFLVLCKGGAPKDDDPRKEFFEIVRIPAAVSPDAESPYMAAYVDIIQRFVEDAAQSDKVAYAGLKYYNRPGIGARPKESYYRVVVGPYVMLISKEDHKLLLIQKRKTNGKAS